MTYDEQKDSVLTSLLAGQTPRWAVPEFQLWVPPSQALVPATN
jgi:hypothetical protein